MKAPFALLVAFSLTLACSSSDDRRVQPPPQRPAQAAQAPRPAAPPAAKAVQPFRMGAPDVVVLFTDSTNGVLEPCNCAGGMLGGLSRRSGLVHSYRAAFPDLLLVDTGDALRLGHGLDPRNEYLLRAYRQIGYDVVVLSDHEWSTDPAALRRLVTKGPPEFLSTTANFKGGALPVARVARRELGHAKIAILSDAPRASPPLLSPDVALRLSFLAPQGLAAEVAKLKKEGRVVIVTSHGVEAEAKEVARTRGVDIVVQGHYRSGGAVPASLSKPPILPAGDFEYVGVLALKVKGGTVVDLEYRREIADSRWPMDERLWNTYEEWTRVALRHAADLKTKDGMVFTSSVACGKCHEPQFSAYQRSGHAHAYDTLLRVGREGDPDCLSCHTTGFASASGFETIGKTPQLANVNCQDCHVFSMKEHDARGFKAPKIDASTCTRCHTGTTDPSFDFAKRMAKASCTAEPEAPIRDAEVRGAGGHTRH